MGGHVDWRDCMEQGNIFTGEKSYGYEGSAGGVRGSSWWELNVLWMCAESWGLEDSPKAELLEIVV